MKIKKMLSSHRNDFRAIYECEHCEHAYESYGYNDHYFHAFVIPSWTCPECNKKRDTTPEASDGE